jgi:hypothetical protein
VCHLPGKKKHATLDRKMAELAALTVEIFALYANAASGPDESKDARKLRLIEVGEFEDDASEES